MLMLAPVSRMNFRLVWSPMRPSTWIRYPEESRNGSLLTDPFSVGFGWSSACETEGKKRHTQARESSQRFIEFSLDRGSGEEELHAPGQKPQFATNLFVLLTLSSPNAVMALDLASSSPADLSGLGPLSHTCWVHSAVHPQAEFGMPFTRFPIPGSEIPPHTSIRGNRAPVR